MRIQHNIMAMNAYRNYNTNTSALSKNLEKLSSGYKINRAGDDAAGLAISEKMRAQITGLNAAQKNVKDGISLVKTAEGAMQEIQDMLNRMDYLATQSANGTYDDPVDRANLQKEVKALRSEIDRIADSANFNGINLLDGSQATTKKKTADAVAAPDPAIDASSIEASTKKDGQHPSSATKATMEIQLDGTTALAAADSGLSADVTGGTTTVKDLGDMTVGGVALKDVFDIKVSAGGTDVTDWTSTTAIDAGAKITLTAKTAGALKAGIGTAVDGKDAVKYVNGKDEGAAPDGTKAKYSLTFDFTKLAGGQRIEIGDKKFEISTSGTASAGYTAIDLSGIDLTVAGDKNGLGTPAATASTGRNLAIEKIQNAIQTAFTDFNVDAAPDTDIGTATTYTINFEAKNAETAANSYNLGDVRVSETDGTTVYQGKGGITGTYNPGQLGGNAKPGTYATVTFDKFDLSKLAVGDKVTIYGKTIEVVEKAEDARPNEGKLVLDDAKDSGKFIAAFERMFRDAAQGGNKQQNFGKLTIAGTKLTVTDAQDVGRTADQLIQDVGLKFVAKNPGSATDAKYETSGGLTLQIGDTSKDYNQLTVSIGDMHVKAMGTNYTVTTGSDGKEVRADNLDANGNVAVISGKSINDIDISTQKGAQDAIDVIRDAINYVSSIRGDLGAVQNRLEHTANNLSVMAENIQDAESTIRDTDVAEEMMAYTKNNILVQSAQAMLAQANAVPQGVLQLLG